MPEETKSVSQPDNSPKDEKAVKEMNKAETSAELKKAQQPEVTTPAEPVKPYVFNDVAFKAHVEELNVAVKEAEGKPNYNPHLYLQANNFLGLMKRYKLGERSQEVFDGVVGLSSTIPPINPDYVEPMIEKVQLPTGLRPPTRTPKA